MKLNQPAISVPPYSVFSKYYDQAMGNQTAKIALLKGFIARQRPQAQSILELACGTGTILSGFADHFEVTGLDQSPEMLAVASHKLPGARFYQGDMANFHLDRRFDVILCIFNSVNHLQRFGQWESVFERAYEHLEPEGLFIFDMNSLERLRAISRLPRSLELINNDYVSIDLEDLGDHFQWLVRIFQHSNNNSYELYKEEIPEVAFPVERVESSLGKYFTVSRTHTVKGHEGEDIIYFVGQKKALD